MSNFILQTSHPLIQSEQTFVLDRKLISIHSVDRDYQKWPNSNHFGIDLGEAFHNVQSMRLINFAVPSNNYTFSTAYQNTKMSFTYSVNYPFYLSGFLPVAFASEWVLMYEILIALFGSTPPVLPNNVSFQYYDQVNSQWTTMTSANLAANAPGINPTNWSGIARLIWTPPEFSITIPEGSYSPTNLAETIQTLMNKEIYNASSGTGLDFLPGPAETPNLLVPERLKLSAGTANSYWTNGEGINPIVVYYNSVTNKILFGARNGEIGLNFAKQEIYDPTCDVNKAIFHQYTKWGLPSYLGFDKKLYPGTIVDVSSNADPYQSNIAGGLYLPFEPTTPWLTFEGRYIQVNGNGATFSYPSLTAEWAGVTALVGSGMSAATLTPLIPRKLVSWIGAEFNLDINGEDALYMEIDRYNSIDEIYPYSERTGHLYNNDLGHRVNGSFAKIPLTHVPFGQEMGSRNNFVLNVFHSDPPIQRIDRLKFTFRFHDGRLVDFKNLPFSFTLEFNMLKDEQTRGKSVRVPPLYNL